MKKQHKIHHYRWQGTYKNQSTSGEISAISINFAKANLQAQGILLNHIQKKRIDFFRKFHQRVIPKDILLFLRQLSTLISSGIPLLQCCDILQKIQEKIPLKLLINSIKNEIEAGKGFSSSLKNYPHYFNELSYQLLQAGELSGSLEIMLNRTATYQERMIHLKKLIQQALFYPIIVSFIAISITMMMLIFIVPQFEELFSTLHNSLPFFTRFVFFLSKLLRHYAWITILPLIGIYLFFYYLKKSSSFKQSLDHFCLHCPLLHHFFKKIFLARFSRSLSILLIAGIPITEALKISAYTVNNHNYLKAILALQTHITTGQSLHSAMQYHSLFPDMTIQMIKIGEESGTLAKMLEKIADFYEGDIHHIITQLSTLLEPLIMVILGVLIGGLVVAMYLPIFKLGTLF